MGFLDFALGVVVGMAKVSAKQNSMSTISKANYIYRYCPHCKKRGKVDADTLICYNCGQKI